MMANFSLKFQQTSKTYSPKDMESLIRNICEAILDGGMTTGI